MVTQSDSYKSGQPTGMGFYDQLPSFVNEQWLSSIHEMHVSVSKYNNMFWNIGDTKPEKLNVLL